MRKQTFFWMALVVTGLTAQAHAQETAYAIANGGTTLIRFQTDAPGSAVAVGNFNGGASVLDAIDFRPLNGQLYGYLDSTDTLYTVDLNTATLTAVASGSGVSATNTFLLGMDFNPTIDRVRVVTDSTQNLVYNPNSNAAPTVATNLFYGAGDPNAASPALVVESAYTNNVAGAFGSTVQYGIDYGLGNLVTIANNAGTLTTIGSLGVSINQSVPYVGFDIYTTLMGTNTAYAVFDTTPGNAPTFNTVNLVTGAATPVGAIGGGFNQVYSLAIRPAMAPEPGTLALTLMGAGGMGILLRRKRHTA